jgi:Icc protein
MAEPQGKLRGADVRDNASRVFAHIGSLGTASKPDLLLLNGDISHDGSASSYSYVTSRLDTISAPYLVTPGNHDTSGPFSADFASLPKTVKLGQSYALHLLDSRVPGQEHGQLTRSNYGFLTRVLSEPAAMHIIAFHHDVLQVEHFRRPGMPVDAASRLLSAVAESRAGRVIVLCSHRHQFARAVLGRVLFLTTGAVSCQFDFTHDGLVVTSDDPEFVTLDLDSQLDYDSMCHRTVLTGP